MTSRPPPCSPFATSGRLSSPGHRVPRFVIILLSRSFLFVLMLYSLVRNCAHLFFFLCDAVVVALSA
jgi:hypothetical protein